MERGIPAQESDLYLCFVAWITTGLRHEAIRLGRRKQRRFQHEILILDSPVSDSAGGSEDAGRVIDLIAAPDDTEEEAEQRAILEDIMAILTPAQQKVISALAMQGLTERMAARSLGVSQPTVHRIKQAALRRIRLHLARGR